MDRQQAKDALSQISRAFDRENCQPALEQAQQLKGELLAASPADPLLLGWARFYEYRCLYSLGRYQDAYDLLTSNEPESWVVSQTNAAYMFSIGSELAMHLGLPEEIGRWGAKCLELRLEADDHIGAAQCAQTVCTLLARLGRDDLNERFADYLIALGRQSSAERPTIAGWRALADNVARCPDRARSQRLGAGIAELRAIDDDRFGEEARSALDRLLEVRSSVLGRDGEEGKRSEQDEALLVAAREGDTPAALQLLENGARVDAVDGFGRTALSHAAFGGHHELVCALLDLGANVHRANMQARTPLVLAADQGHAQIVRSLIGAGADLNHRGICGQTALIVASWQGHLETVQVLLDAGADLRIEDDTGNTALTLTATEPQVEVVELLLERGADVDGCNEEQQMGQTALIKAAMNGQREIVSTLLTHGADREHRDQNGLTAAAWAREEGHPELARLLSSEQRS